MAAVFAGGLVPCDDSDEAIDGSFFGLNPSILCDMRGREDKLFVVWPTGALWDIFQ